MTIALPPEVAKRERSIEPKGSGWYLTLDAIVLRPGDKVAFDEEFHEFLVRTKPRTFPAGTVLVLPRKDARKRKHLLEELGGDRYRTLAKIVFRNGERVTVSLDKSQPKR